MANSRIRTFTYNIKTMTDKFILLTTTDNNPVIIGLSNISSIEKYEPQKENTETAIFLNFARGNDRWPKVIIVNESFE